MALQKDMCKLFRVHQSRFFASQAVKQAGVAGCSLANLLIDSLVLVAREAFHILLRLGQQWVGLICWVLLLLGRYYLGQDGTHLTISEGLGIVKDCSITAKLQYTELETVFTSIHFCKITDQRYLRVLASDVTRQYPSIPYYAKMIQSYECVWKTRTGWESALCSVLFFLLRGIPHGCKISLFSESLAPWA